MPACHICGDNSGLGYTCNECGGKHCSDHRLPEAHRCPGLTVPIKHTTRGHSGSASESSSGFGYLLLPILIIAFGLVMMSALSGFSLGASPLPDSSDIGHAVSDVGGAVSDTLNDSNTTSTETEPRYNETEIKIAMHKRVNQIRADRGLQTLQPNRLIATSADDHAVSMKSDGELYHSDLKRTYPSYCNRVGENVAYTYADSNVRTGNGSVNYYGNETAIGYGIVRQWMNSPGHRKNILRPEWTSEGFGISFDYNNDGTTEVWATQGFCA